MSNTSASILARLKNKAKIEGISFQQLLNLFFQEEFIRRLSKSKYREQLILKGGYLLYSISNFTTRPTVDADYLLRNYSNEPDLVNKLVRSILNENTGNEFMRIELIDVERISEMREYNGMRVNLLGHLGNTRTPFYLDLGVGDTIVPAAVFRTLPVILDDFEKSNILTYSLESTISEKLDAIIRFMEATGRMKDFYDIYYLATTFEFEGRELQEAIYETLSTRGTYYEKDSIKVFERLIMNEAIISRWNIFCKKILRYELSFEEVVGLIISLLDPPFLAMVNEVEFNMNWNSDKKIYE